jgi:hypothetical protein
MPSPAVVQKTGGGLGHSVPDSSFFEEVSRSQADSMKFPDGSLF